MIYLVYGTDTEKARAKFSALRLQLEKKRPDASVFAFDQDSWDAVRFEELLDSQTLFAGKSLVVCRELCAHPEAREVLRTRMKQCAESENIFLFFEGELLKEDEKLFGKHAEKVQEESLEKAPPTAEKFPIFSLTDALGRRDRRSAWVLYQGALRAGFAPEEIFWKCIWQFKNMLLAVLGAETPSAQTLGMNPYVFKKSAESARNFSTSELREKSRELLVLHHESRRGKRDFPTGLERFILDL